jgi:hypothetical protein
MQHFEEPLEAPDLHIAGLRLWVHGRQFPMADDYWDGNWLQVTVHCGAPGARVWVTGPILHVSEIAHFLRGVEAIYASLQGEATLPCMEPELGVTLTAEGRGHITMVVAITPDHLSQAHRFTFTLDQSYLPPVMDYCRTLLRQYPIKGQP